MDFMIPWTWPRACTYGDTRCWCHGTSRSKDGRLLFVVEFIEKGQLFDDIPGSVHCVSPAQQFDSSDDGARRVVFRDFLP